MTYDEHSKFLIAQSYLLAAQNLFDLIYESGNINFGRTELELGRV